ncbi:MAG: FkbM family methyltransferase [Bryobacteraceae bacterium]
MRILRVVLALFLLADAAFLVIFWPPARLFALCVAGRSSCPLEATLGVPAESARIDEARQRMRAGSRRVRTEAGLELWETPQGPFWIPPSTAGSLHIVLAEQELEYYGAGAQAVHAGDVVLDCGADIGSFTRRALRHGASLVVAIEPMPEKEPCLRRTFSAEIAEGRVIVYPKGVWDKPDTLTLHGDSVVERRAGKQFRVPLATIDSIAAELKLSRVDYIKMDVEGAEPRALAGARSVIQRFRPRLSIATEHAPDDALAIPRLVRSMAAGYRAEPLHCMYDSGRVRPEVLHFYWPNSRL